MTTKKEVLSFGNLKIEVTHKNIKNVHLSVHPPQGRVTVSAPTSMDLETIRLFTIAKLGWIRKQQKKFLEQKREVDRDFVTRESHYYVGERYLLKVVEEDLAPAIELKHRTLVMYVRPGATREQKESLMQGWYRKQLKEIASPMMKKWSKKLQIEVNEICIRAMKTKWGTCNEEAKRIWLNTELAKKSLESIEYVLVHEMVHFLERKHNDIFIGYMDKFLPKWRGIKQELNQVIQGYEDRTE
jgi:predicted metal-dependent hydrolase